MVSGAASSSDPVIVAVMHRREWDNRPADEIAADLRSLGAVDPRVVVIDVRYDDPDDLRVRRGRDPAADLRHLAPELTAAQRRALARAEVIIGGDLPYDVVTLAPRLRWVQSVGSGVGHLLSAGIPSTNVRLTTAAGVNAVPVAEFVFSRLLQVAKRLPEIDRLGERRSWEKVYGRQVRGGSLTVIGLGAIGRHVARLGRAFGMRVTAVRRTARSPQADPDVDLLLGPAELHRAVAAADYVVAALPESPQTIGVFNARFFAAMRQGAVFVNVGRGSAVEEQDLVAALRHGRLSYAALDVARQEPLPATSPLWTTPRLLLSPHTATAPEQQWRNLYELFRDNLARYLAGEPLRNRVALDPPCRAR